MNAFKLIMLIILSLLLGLTANSQVKASGGQDQRLEYFSVDNGEAQFTIDGQLKVNQTTAPTRDQVDPLIRKQMRFMFGLMRSREITAAALYPKFTYTISNVLGNGKASFLVRYSLKAKGIFQNSATEYTFNIPYNPNTLFAASQGKCMVGEEADESNFWYHWEPLKAGCPLKENVDYYTFKTQLMRIPNTTETYPEYAKLVDNNKTIKMTMFFGFSNYDFQIWDPDTNADDWGIRSINLQRTFLKQLGFKETPWTNDQVAKIYVAKDKFIPHVFEMTLSGNTANLRIRLVLSDTGLAHNSAAFHAFLRNSLAQESVIVYDGHSGIGKNLDLSSIEKLRGFKFAMNPNYQILFLGSCVPYAYYPDMFFARKKTAQDPNGTLKLDIFTYGKESTFGNNEDHELTKALVAFATQNVKKSYQSIIRASPNYYFGINGD
ncbi:MAG: hypothetical protein ACXVAX_11255, partial [Pseudobdellovibrio sp.]